MIKKTSTDDLWLTKKLKSGSIIRCLGVLYKTIYLPFIPRSIRGKVGMKEEYIPETSLDDAGMPGSEKILEFIKETLEKDKDRFRIDRIDGNDLEYDEVKTMIIYRDPKLKKYEDTTFCLIMKTLTDVEIMRQRDHVLELYQRFDKDDPDSRLIELNALFQPPEDGLMRSRMITYSMVSNISGFLEYFGENFEKQFKDYLLRARGHVELE